MRQKKPPLVEVEWIDARDVMGGCAYEPEKIKAFATLIRRTTSGFLAYQDDEALRLAHDYDGAEDPPEVGNFTVIPTGWVQKIIYRTGHRKRKSKK